MMKIAKDCAVQMHYHLTADDGTVIDSSRGRGPLSYLHGHGHLVRGVEAALDGKTVGDTFNVVVPPEDGYGKRDPNLDVAIPLSAFPPGAEDELVDGSRFRGPHPASAEQTVTYLVLKVEDDTVICTANHPLADMTLHFDIEVVEVRQGTEDEIATGQVKS
ncbi:MAG: peptidylprolyl isomerase [Myxococcota bacterium]|nr:peptidylprolyl isomerase [Myxococcota bacterium]